jgi:pilus assembly protein Flp/PilA
MRNFLTSLWKDESGAAAAEYALILAVVGAGIAAGAALLGGAIDTEIRAACGEIQNGAGGAAC